MRPRLMPASAPAEAKNKSWFATEEEEEEEKAGKQSDQMNSSKNSQKLSKNAKK